MESFELSLSPAQLNQTRRALAQCNEASARYGLVLSEAQMAALARRRSQALRSTGRVEFGEGVLPKLATAGSGWPTMSSATPWCWSSSAPAEAWNFSPAWSPTSCVRSPGPAAWTAPGWTERCEEETR